MTMNMSYCRFQNTLLALEECKDALNEGYYDFEGYFKEELSEEEFSSMIRLIKLCQEISESVDVDELEELESDEE